jgi:predicted transcriptional regulator
MKPGTFEFPLPADLLEQLREYARGHDMSMAQVIRQALREFLGREL